MATGHLNPGYGDVVSRLYRARSAHPGSLHRQRRMDVDGTEGADARDMSLEEIKERAKRMWLQKDTNATTYSNHYKNKTADMRELGPNDARPVSPGRRNNPHPPQVFLTCAVSSVPGYYDPDKGQPYKVDASVAPHEQRRRHALRSKFTTRPSTAAILQYCKPKELQVIEDPRERQATEAWLKLATDKDRAEVGDLLKNEYLQKYGAESPVAQMNSRSISVVAVKPSLHRWNKFAGPIEKERLQEMIGAYDFDPRQRRPRTTIGRMRHRDIDRMKNTTYVHHSKRGDFLLHPEWPPTIPHHRLNGLSTVDLPYGTAKR